MSQRFRHLFFAPDEVPGAGDAKREEPKKEEPKSSDKEKELLKEVAKLRKERDAFEADAKRYRAQAQEGARRKIAEDLVDERYAKFLPDVDFDDDGKPTAASQKVLDDFRSEFPDFFKTSAGAGAKKEEQKKDDKKPVPPAGSGGKTRQYWDDMKKTDPAKWRLPATQREYAEWLDKQS